MSVLHLLGTGAAVTDPHRTTTMLAVESNGRSVLVDCGGDVVQRALLAGLDLDGIDALIITHEHPDHVAGFPLFMERIWLHGRVRPIPVYGIGPAIAQARRSLEAFNTESWSLPSIEWHEVALEEGAAVLSLNGLDISASPGVHGVPVTGLRIVERDSGTVVSYTADTEPCESIARLCTGSDLLIHEATGESKGHSSIEQAVAAAEAAGSPTLVLVHLPAGLTERDVEHWVGSDLRVILGEELDRFEF